MAAVTVCSDFVAKENKTRHCFHFSPFYLLWSDGTRCHDLRFTNIYLHLVCSHVLVIVKNAAVIMWMHISFQVSFFVFLHQYSEIQLLAYGNSTFNFWGTSILFSMVAAHYCQQCTRGLISQHPCKHLLFLLFMVFLMIAILKDVRWYLIMVLICISLMISNIEHLFMYLLDICMSYLERCWFRSFADILFELFGFLTLSYKNYLYIFGN